MKRVLPILLLLYSFMFGETKVLTVLDVLKTDLNMLKNCTKGECDEELTSYADFGIQKTSGQLISDSDAWQSIIICSNNLKAPECNKVLASKQTTQQNFIEETTMGLFNSLFSLIFIGAFLVWVTTWFIVVKQKTAVIIEVFGKFSSVKKAGLNFKPPFPFGVAVGKVNLQIRELESDVGVKSADMAFLTVPVKVQFKVLEENIKESYYELDNPENQLNSYILNMVRSKASSLTMDQLFASKDEFEDDVKKSLNEKFSPFGYVIENVLVDDPQPSDEIVKAFNRVLASEREKDAAKNEAEALKIKLVGEAIAEKESLILKGEAFKAYRAKIAEGNTEAMALMLGKSEIVDELREFTEEIPLVVKEEDGNEKVEISQVVVKRVTKVLKEKEKPIISTLTEKNVLDFFSGVDQREAIRDAAKGQGNTVVVPLATQSSCEIDYGQLAGLIQALNNKS